MYLYLMSPPYRCWLINDLLLYITLKFENLGEHICRTVAHRDLFI